MRFLSSSLLAAVTSALVSTAAWAAPECSIAALARLQPAGVEITSVKRKVADGTEFCLVEASMETVNNQLRFSLGLPKNWNGKYLFEATGGSVGVLVDVAPAVRRGYAAVTTDAGHDSYMGDFDFWFNEEQRTDWIHRAVHTATVGSKALVKAYYGRAPAHSLLRGCSNGGRAGLMEAQRHPDEYDGILSAAPASDPGLGLLVWIWEAQTALRGNMSADDWKLVGKTVRAACDAKDGLRDGLIQDGRRCELPREKLACRAGQTTGCLDAARLATVERMWSRPTLSDGTTLPGGNRGYEDELPNLTYYARTPPLELLKLLANGKDHQSNNFSMRPPEPPPPLSVLLPMLFTGAPSALEAIAKAFGTGVLLPTGRRIDVKTFDVVKDGVSAMNESRKLIDVTHTADLNAYLRRGAKLLMWHGMADATLQPELSYRYFERARANAAQGGIPGEKFDQQVLLYTAPAIGHCDGGSGPDSADLLAALDAWVTRGKTPGAIRTERLDGDGRIVRSRPICALPKEPRYSGKGSIDAAESFTCAVPPDRVGMTGLKALPR